MHVELARRPGANLLRLLKKQGRDLTEFAVEVGMSQSGEPRHALANIRQYTHAAEPTWPRVPMVERWAKALNVDPVEFYKDAK